MPPSARRRAQPAPTWPSPMADLPAGATFGSLVHGVLEDGRPVAPDLVAELPRHVREQLAWWPVDATRRRARRRAGAAAPHPARAARRRADPGRDRRCPTGSASSTSRSRWPAATPAPRRRRPARATWAPLLRQHLAAGRPARCRTPTGCASRASATSRCAATSPARSTWCSACPATAGGHRYLVVDYKTNRLGEPEPPLTAADYAPRPAGRGDAALRLPAAGAALHRRRAPLPALAPARLRPRRHLGGVLYLYVRGMCGPETPLVDGHPAGVFSWQPPAGAGGRAVRPARRPGGGCR